MVFSCIHILNYFVTYLLRPALINDASSCPGSTLDRIWTYFVLVGYIHYSKLGR